MPRKQLDIIKDLIIAHYHKDNEKFDLHFKEYIRYLEWKGFKNKVEEFNKILDTGTNVEKKQLEIFLNNLTEKESKDITINISPEKVCKSGKTKKENVTTWQVAYSNDIDFIQINRLLNELIQKEKSSYSYSDIGSIFGFTKDGTRGFIGPIIGFGLIDRDDKTVTELGKLILKYDSYFEDIGTLWFLHYYISSQPHLILWNRLSNIIFPKQNFNFKDFSESISDLKNNYTKETFSRARREYTLYIRAYLNTELSKLKIFKEIEKEQYQKDNITNVPDEILLASILLYKERFFSNEVTLEIKNLLNNTNSPGTLFYLNESKLRESIERLRQKGLLIIESFADLDQIKFTHVTNYIEMMKYYYEQKFKI